MFSAMCLVILSTEGVPMWPLPVMPLVSHRSCGNPPPHIQPQFPQDMLNLFSLDLTILRPPDMFKRVHCVVRTVVKQAVGIRLKYLLICNKQIDQGLKLILHFGQFDIMPWNHEMSVVWTCLSQSKKCFHYESCNNFKIFSWKYLSTFSLFSYTADIGGQLGLCLGASILTVVEFLEFLFSLLSMKFLRINKRHANK